MNRLIYHIFKFDASLINSLVYIIVIETNFETHKNTCYKQND